MLPKSFNRISELSLEYKDPNGAKWLMREFLDKSIAYTKAIKVRNVIEEFIKNKVALKDVNPN